MLHRMHESELIIHYTLDHAGIMIVTDLIRDMPEMDVISTLTYLEKCNYAAVMIWVCHNLL